MRSSDSLRYRRCGGTERTVRLERRIEKGAWSGRSMRKSRFTEEQIAFTLRQGEAGAPTEEISGKLGVTEATCFRSKRKHAGLLGASELGLWRQVRDANRKQMGISTDDVEAMALGIAERRKTLAPAGDTTCVFRDRAFGDDVAKTNLILGDTSHLGAE